MPMRKLLTLVILLSASTSVLGEDKNPPLNGTYLLVGVVDRGEVISEEMLSQSTKEDRTIVIKDGKLIPMKEGKKPSVMVLDPSKSPAELDLKETKEGKTVAHAIYKLEGDTLTICLVESEKATDRPKEFKSPKGSRAVLLTLKKQEK